MIRALKNDTFSISASLVNDDGTMGTGTIAYTVRNAITDAVLVPDVTWTLTLSAVTGLYYANIIIPTVGAYRVYFTCSGFPSMSEDIIVLDEATETNVDANETKIDSVISKVDVIDGIVDDIKTETLTHPTLTEIEATTVLAKEATLTTISGYIDTEITTLISAVAALQTDLGDPSVDVTTIYAQVLLVKGYVDELETRLTATRAGYLDNLSGGAVALNSTVTNATYGLSALQVLIDAIDTSTELTAKFTEIKGAGWTTTETLKAIKDAIDLIDATAGITAADVWTYVTRNLTPPVVDVSGLPGINHDTGGADTLRYVDSGDNGIDNAFILAYLKTDYDLGNTSSSYIKGSAKTLPDGRWFAPIYVVSGTYILVFTKTSEFGPDTAEVTV